MTQNKNTDRKKTDLFNMKAPSMSVEEMRIRKTQLRYTYAEIAELSGLPIGTVQKVLTGATASPRAGTLLALEKALARSYDEEAEQSLGNKYEQALAQTDVQSSGQDPARLSGTVREEQNKLYPFGEQEIYTRYLNNPVSVAKREENKKTNRYTDLAGSEFPQGLLAEPASSYLMRMPDAPNGLTIFGYPRGPYNVEDYDALPDDQRVELIDGYFFRMEAPTSLHQELLTELVYRFKDYQKKNRPDCRVLPAPFDVQLDRDKYTMIQPDISIICDKGRIVRRGCFGAPDFVVEILSDSTRTKDMYTKLAKYKNAGVREYWMVDPKKEKILVYYYENEDVAAVYDFESVVPVGISGGDLKIDFAEIMEELRKWSNYDQ